MNVFAKMFVFVKIFVVAKVFVFSRKRKIFVSFFCEKLISKLFAKFSRKYENEHFYFNPAQCTGAA
jgi:hypothetical protein